jgi:hypothetical protein
MLVGSAIFSVCFISVVSFNIINPTNYLCKSSALEMNYKNDKYARYSSGTVVENLNISPKRKEKRIVETIRKSDFDSSLSDDSTSTGNDLRKNRNKDLKTVKRDQPKVLRPIGKVSNWNQTDIDLVITSLNLSYGDKSREELTAT